MQSKSFPPWICLVRSTYLLRSTSCNTTPPYPHYPHPLNPSPSQLSSKHVIHILYGPPTGKSLRIMRERLGACQFFRGSQHTTNKEDELVRGRRKKTQPLPSHPTPLPALQTPHSMTKASLTPDQSRSINDTLNHVHLYPYFYR